MLNIRKYRRGLNFQQYTELWIAHIRSGIYEYLTLSRGSHCKNESLVIAISGNWEHETGLLRLTLTLTLTLIKTKNNSKRRK